MRSFIKSQANSSMRGDTMVEVLIAIAVVTLVLGGAYVTTNQSLQATRATQERAIALKLAESQIERLKSLMATDPDLITGTTFPFCISTASEVKPASDAACAVGSSGESSSAEPIFHLSVESPVDDYYVVTETWQNVAGRTTDSLQLRYRVYE